MKFHYLLLLLKMKFIRTDFIIIIEKNYLEFFNFLKEKLNFNLN
jgi:hypothetical protein